MRTPSTRLSAACLAFARSGPLWPAVRNSGGAEEWAFHGSALVDQLLPGDPLAGASAPEQLDAAVAKRVYHLYLPVFFWCRDLVRSRKDSERALAIGLSAPQGCGKTTLVNFLVDRFAAENLACAAVSFDDFYLTGAAQDELAASHPDNPLLQARPQTAPASGTSPGPALLLSRGGRRVRCEGTRARTIYRWARRPSARSSAAAAVERAAAAAAAGTAAAAAGRQRGAARGSCGTTSPRAPAAATARRRRRGPSSGWCARLPRRGGAWAGVGLGRGLWWG